MSIFMENPSVLLQGGNTVSIRDISAMGAASYFGSFLGAGASITVAQIRPIECIAGNAIQSACAASLNSDEILASFTIPANTLGPNSILQIEPVWSFLSSANNKILRVKVASAIIYDVTRTTSTREGPLIVLANRNSLTSQIIPYDNAYFTAGTGAVVTHGIDFAVNVTVQITGQRAAAEALALEYFRVLHIIGD